MGPIPVEGTHSHWCAQYSLPLGRSLDSKKLFEPVLVEPDSKLLAYHDDRHPHLTAFLYHFPALFEVGRDVVVGVLYLARVKKFFRHVAEMTCRRRVNGHWYIFCHINISRLIF